MLIFQVIRSLKRVLQQVITDISVKFDLTVPKLGTTYQSPETLSPVFAGEKLVLYGLVVDMLQEKKERVEGVAVLNLEIAGNPILQRYEVPFSSERNLSSNSDIFPVHRLAAKALITDWQNAGKSTFDIVRLSTESNVVSSQTAFIAIDEENSKPVQGALQTWDIRPKFASAQSFNPFQSAAGGFAYQSVAAFGSGAAYGGGVPLMQPASLSAFGESLLQEWVGQFHSYTPISRHSSLPLFHKCEVTAADQWVAGVVLGVKLLGVMLLMAISSMSARNAPLQHNPYQQGFGFIKLSAPGGGLVGTPPALSARSAPQPPSQSSWHSDDLVSRGMPEPASEPIKDSPRQVPDRYAVFDCFSSEKSSSTTPTDILSTLIAAQQADGSWKLSSTLSKILSKTEEEIKLASPVELKESPVLSEVWTTVLVLAILEKKCRGQRDEWELMAMKADKWLKKQILPEGVELARFFASSHGFMDRN